MGSTRTVKVSVDCGYDGVKVLVEDGTSFWCPAEVLSERYHTLPKVLQSRQERKGIILYEVTGERFAIGELARDFKKSLYGNADLDDLHIENETRFGNPNFKRVCLAAIYCALRKAGIEIDNDLRVELIVAVPHVYLSQANLPVKKLFAGRQDLAVQIGNEEPVDISINVSKVSVGSQVILAIIGYAADDHGILERLDAERDFPMLFYDLGYGTSGIAEIEPGLAIGAAVSNREDTMMQANMRAAKAVSDISKMPCSHQMIESAVRSNVPADSEWKFERGGEYSTIQLADVQQKEITATIESLYMFSKQNFNLPFIRNVIISGGTGTRFYPELSKKFTETKLLSEENVRLATCTYKGKEYESIYAVACGGIKRALSAS